MQEEFLTSLAHIKKKLRLDMDSAFVRLTVRVAPCGYPLVCLGTDFVLLDNQAGGDNATRGCVRHGFILENLCNEFSTKDTWF